MFYRSSAGLPGVFSACVALAVTPHLQSTGSFILMSWPGRAVSRLSR